MSPNPSQLMLQVMGKISLFKGFSPDQIGAILQCCEHRIVEEGQVLCCKGEAADALFFLVAGELARASAEGIRLEQILPVVPIGEVEAILGRVYAATYEASKRSHVFVLQPERMRQLMQDDAQGRGILYANMTEVLAERIEDNDEMKVQWQRERDQVDARIAVLERQLNQQSQKLDLALEYLAQEANLGRGEAENYIDDSLMKLVPRVLVVDDEPDFRHFAKEALSAFMVVEAQSGKEALQLVKTERPDLIIADIRMPEMDGCTLLTNLRSQFPGVPVLAVSGYLEADDLQSYGFDGFIDKPVGVNKLQELVEVALQR